MYDSLFLLDSGSSLPVISDNLFQKLKHNNTCKHIFRKVSNKTINSKVSFNACIEIAFKIQNKFFRHSFFVTHLDPHSVFQGILEFDFMLMHDIRLSLVNSTVTIQETEIALFKDYNVKETVHSYPNQIKNDKKFDDDLTECSSIANRQQNSHKYSSVKMRQKVILEEGEHVYAPVNIEYSKSLLNSDILFIPSIDNSLIKCYLSVHNVAENCDENHEKSTNF